MGAGRLKILFIGGYPRSGSTILDRTLGQVEGFVSLGEMRHFWTCYSNGHLCGCGESLTACPFWDGVVRSAFSGREELDIRRAVELQRRVDRWWRVPFLHRGWGSAPFREDMWSYLALLGRLFSGIREVSRARVMIDSSKDVSHGALLACASRSIDLHVVHLVRDSRAVAYSSGRAKLNPASGELMPRAGALRCAIEWNVVNRLTALLADASSTYRVLPYEEFVGDPAHIVEELCTRIGETGKRLPVADGIVELGKDHTVAGNPDRFQVGLTQIRRDDEWLRRMPTAARLVTTLVTRGSMRRFGYHL
jgi:hypothetical protein